MKSVHNIRAVLYNNKPLLLLNPPLAIHNSMDVVVANKLIDLLRGLTTYVLQNKRHTSSLNDANDITLFAIGTYNSHTCLFGDAKPSASCDSARKMKKPAGIRNCFFMFLSQRMLLERQVISEVLSYLTQGGTHYIAERYECL